MRILKLLVLILLVLFSTTTFAKNKTLRGYVSAVNSPTQFELDDLKINCAAGKTLIIENHGPTEIQRDYDTRYIYLGLEVEVSGDLQDDVLAAKKIDTFPKKPGESVVGTALIERAPQLAQNAGKFEGKIFADGRTLGVTADSELLFRDRTPDAHNARPVPLASADQVKTNIFVSYVAKRANDGSFNLSKAIFAPNYVDNFEQKMRQEKEFEFAPTSISVKHLAEMPLVNDKAVVKRVAEIGMALVPQFQKDLPDEDPTKLHFKFIVVEYKRPVVLGGSNGTILVSRKILPKLQNEAQLAALLGYSTAEVVQKQEFRSKHRLEETAWAELASAAVVAAPVPGLGLGMMIGNQVQWSQYVSQYHQQAARLSLEYMLNAGWDIREAPDAWRMAYGKHHGEPGHDTATPLTGYLLCELRNYADVDYSKLHKDEQPYSQIALAMAKK